MKPLPRWYTVPLFLVIAVLFARSQDVEKLDPSLDQILPTSATLERVATGFKKWVEGPVWTHDGSLLFAEIPANNIDIWVPGQNAHIFIHPSGYEGTTPFKGPEPGSNGMTLDSKGRVTIAGHARRNVWRLESVNPKAQITVLADSYQGKKLNSPNDLVYRSDGSLYFTDPPYGLPTQGDNDPAKELQVNGVLPHSRCTSAEARRTSKPKPTPTRNQGPSPAEWHSVLAGRKVPVCFRLWQEGMDALPCSGGWFRHGWSRVS